MNQDKCPSCGSLVVELECYAEELDHKGLHLHVEGLEQYRCKNCDYAFVTHNLHDQNIAKIKLAFLKARATYKSDLGLLSGEEIRSIRKKLDLTQQEAAKLFGGGINAFSKYENEEIVQAVSIDRLIRLVANLGTCGLDALRAVSGERQLIQAAAMAPFQVILATQIVSETAYMALGNWIGTPGGIAERAVSLGHRGRAYTRDLSVGYIRNPLTDALVRTPTAKRKPKETRENFSGKD